MGRETPLYSLQYMILSFGGAFVTDDDEIPSKKVTHHVMDRPLADKVQANREYVQPQWIVDSVNSMFQLPTAPYKPGQAPPPHLSPFVDNSKEGYVPERQKEILALKGEDIDESSESENEDADEETPAPKDEAPKQAAKGDADSSSEDEDSEEEVAQKQKKAKNMKLKKEL